MDFIKEFAVIQGTLLTLQKKIGVLKNLTNEDINKEKIQNAVEILTKTLNNFKEVSPLEDDFKLRQITLFLILNTDLSVCDLLLEDTHCGHIIDSAPKLSKDLLIEVLLETVLSKYLYEVIRFCPPVLAVEVLDIAIKELNRKNETLVPSHALSLATTIYVKLLSLENESDSHVCEIDCVALKYMNFFTTTLEFFANSEIFGEQISPEHCKDLGYHIKFSLDLVTSCLKLYIEPEEASNDMCEIYKMDATFDYKKWHQEPDEVVFDNIHKQLFSVLIVHIARISVDLWLEWAEIDSRCSTDSSLQNDVAEAMYKCCEVIKVAQTKGLQSDLLGSLMPMLSSMARKPHCEDDEIAEADLELILKRIPDKSFSQQKWLLSLFSKFDVLYKDECVACIKSNIHLMNKEITSLFLHKIISCIENDKTFALSEDAKNIFLNAVNQLCLRDQLNILKEFLEKFGAATHLCCEDYASKITRLFNTAIDHSSLPSDEKYTDFVIMSFQNTLDVIKRLLRQGVASDKQAKIMADILLMLRPLHSLREDTSKEDTPSLMLNVLLNIMQEHKDMEFVESSFISLVVLLVVGNAISADDFLKFNLLPLLHESVAKKQWSDVVLWLQMLQVFVDDTEKYCQSLDPPVLLLVLAQIMETSRGNLFSFSSLALTACELAIRLSSTLLESFHSDVKGHVLTKLCTDLMALVSPINLLYFISLWPHSESCPINTTDWKVYLLHWTSTDICNMKPPWSSGDGLSQNKLVFELLQLLPACTLQEWHTVGENLLNIMSPKSYESAHNFVFGSLANVIEIMALVSSSPGLTDCERECSYVCLDSCVRNFATVAKEEILSRVHSISLLTSSTMLQRAVHLNHVLPRDVQESCSGLLLNVQMDIISCAVSEMQMNWVQEDEGEKSNGTCFEEALKAMGISIMSIQDEKHRQLLARKLLEGSDVVVM